MNSVEIKRSLGLLLLTMLLGSGHFGCDGAEDSGTSDPGATNDVAVGTTSTTTSTGVLDTASATGSQDTDTTGSQTGTAADCFADPVIPTMEFGRCVTDDGRTCAGLIHEGENFQTMLDPQPMTLVTGPQQAEMLVLMVRTTGIDPGDASQPASQLNPVLEVQARAGSELLAHFKGRATFNPDSATGQLTSNIGVFVVIDRPATELFGLELSLAGRLVDRNGQVRCGRVQVAIVDPADN